MVGEPALLSQRSQVLPDVLSFSRVHGLRVLTAHQNLALLPGNLCSVPRQTRQHEVSFTLPGRSLSSGWGHIKGHLR